MDARKKLEKIETGHLETGSLFLDRELSLLAFNRRVLAQAEDPQVPLLERLRYLCIVCSNLDEFFEIRIASLLAQAKQGGTSADFSSHDLSSERIGKECHRLVEYQYALLNNIILPELAKQGIHLLRHEDRNEAQREWVKEYFEREVRPLLTPIGLDPAHPFPQVINKSLNFIIELSGQDPFGRSKGIAIIKAPRVLPRVIRLPDHLSDKGTSFCLLSSIIHAHIADLFPGREVTAYSQFRVTRNSDLWLEELEGKDLRQAVQSELHSRHFGAAIRLEVSRNCPAHIADFLLNQFSIHPSRLYAVDGPVNLVRLQELIGYVQQPDLHFQPFSPGLPNLLVNADIFSVLKSQDILLHHPFQSFEPVIDFVRKAAHDPDVVAIKQTIYRTGMHSDLMESLILAARRGKEVTVIVELMARFDEEANINWAERLERAGAQVIYGVVGLKTHAKLALVLRRENGKLHYYAHLGTGNYHPKTTKLYTDFGLLTAHEGITAEVNEVFIHLASLIRPKSLDYLWLAPFTLQSQFLKAIRAEAAHARQGRSAHIIAKMNGLLDESIICALYEASQAGVKIDLIVRGACTLKPGVPGLSDNIRVRAIVGRFLEHTRVYYFSDNGAQRVYLSSADWMSRNLARRIEVAFPVLDKALKKRVINEGLRPYLKDNANAWELNADGEYRRRRAHTKTASFSAQHYLALSMGSFGSVNHDE